MAASASDKFTYVYQRLTTTLASDKATSATSMSISSGTSWPTDTGIIATVYNLDDNGAIDTATAVSYAGTVSGTTISNLAVVEGTDQLHLAGATVSLLFTATHFNRVVEGILAEHNQDGTHTDITGTTLALTGDIDLADTKGIRDGNNNEVLKIGQTGSAVNEVTVTNAATTNGPTISATGDDTDIDINITPKGTGTIKLNGPTTNPYCFRVTKSADQTGIADVTTTTVTFNTETYDYNGNFASNTYTAPVNGVYNFGAVLQTSGTGTTDAYANIYVNGATSYLLGRLTRLASNDSQWFGGTTDLYLDAGDTVVLRVWVNVSSGTATVSSSNTVFYGKLVHAVVA